MNICLGQHAEAKSKEEDPKRPLTDSGHRDTQAVAAFAAKLGVQVYQIHHSNKMRAKQTAEILGAALSPPGGVIAVSGLDPLDDVQPIASELAATGQQLMLVGHLPFMERLAGQLLAGDASRAVVKFTKAGIVNLAPTESGWQVVWVITPGIASL